MICTVSPLLGTSYIYFLFVGTVHPDPWTDFLHVYTDAILVVCGLSKYIYHEKFHATKFKITRFDFEKFLFQDRIKDLNSQADQFIEGGVWDAESLEVRKRTINERYDKLVHFSGYIFSTFSVENS